MAKPPLHSPPPPHSDHRSTAIAGQLPILSSSSSSSSSSDFEFTVSHSSTLCPADDIFFKGQLLPLHLSPRRSMLRSLLLVSSSSSSSSTSTSRDSNGSSSSNDSTTSYPTDMLLLTEPDSPRPSSATDDDPLKLCRQKPNYLSSLRTKFSSVFNRNKKLAGVTQTNNNVGSNSAKDAIKKYYTKKVKPLYEKLRNKGRERGGGVVSSSSTKEESGEFVHVKRDSSSHSFSGNLRFPSRKRCAVAGSCPSSMRSSPNHSGSLTPSGSLPTVSLSSGSIPVGSHQHFSSDASMEELHSAIQGAIAHCKSSMCQAAGKNHV